MHIIKKYVIVYFASVFFYGKQINKVSEITNTIMPVKLKDEAEKSE